MAENNFEVVTTTDKDQRDRLFQDLRQNGNPLEKQVVKFSSVEQIIDIDTGKPYIRQLLNYAGKNQWHCPEVGVNNFQTRFVFRSTWSVAYPKS